MIKVKVCGLTRECDIEYANIVRPDFIGFVFAPQSRRRVMPDQAACLRTKLGAGICVVGVFVNAPIDDIVDLLRGGVIAAVQLHGRENDDYIEALASRTNAPIIKAFKVTERSDIESAQRTRANYPLLDNGEGGTGRSFDWTLAEPLARNYFLAGGLTPDNVLVAAARLHPYGIDMSSGVETDGVKDFDKMKAVVERVRNFG